MNPGASEVCDDSDTDEDCDGLINDEDDSVTGTTDWFEDVDGDVFGDPATASASCEAPATAVLNDGDCDDTRADVNPDATEVCDALDTDEDCNGLADDLDASPTGTTPFYTDADGDGWGDALSGTRCDILSGEAPVDGDCDNDDADLNLDDADGDTYTTCDGDCDDTDTAAVPETCIAYASLIGDFTGGGCVFSNTATGVSTATYCPDCDIAFEGSATLTSGSCVPAFDSWIGLDLDTYTMSLYVDTYSSGYPFDLGTFDFYIVEASGYDIAYWSGYATSYAYYYGGFIMYP